MSFSWDIQGDLLPYIDEHLAYEMKYLIVAATTWSAVRHEADRARWPDHLVVFAMDSAFVHTRTLCEFLKLKARWANGPLSPHSPPPLPVWSHYSGPVNLRVLHPDPRRPNAAAAHDGDDLKDRVIDLAREVINAWEQVAAQVQMSGFREAKTQALANAIAEGQRSATRMNVPPIAW